MDNLLRTLRVAEALTESVPVPGLTNVIKLSLRLAEMAKEIKDTGDDMRSLAEYAAETTRDIYNTLDSLKEPVDMSEFGERLDNLLSTLQKVEAVMLRPKKKRLLRRIFHSSKYQAELNDLRKELDRTLATFHVLGSIRTEARLSFVSQAALTLVQRMDDTQRADLELHRQAGDTNAALAELRHQVAESSPYDGAMRRFGRDDIEVIGILDPDDSVNTSVKRYKAILRNSGRVVVVRDYSRPDDRFRQEVENAKAIWHPNVVHAIGYSKPDPSVAFIVDDGLYTRSVEVLSTTFQGSEKLKWILEAAKQTYAGLAHLASVRDTLKWSLDDHMAPLLAELSLFVSGHGQILLDPSSCKVDGGLPTCIFSDGTLLFQLSTSTRDRLVKSHKFESDMTTSTRYDYLRALWEDYTTLAGSGFWPSEYGVVWPSLHIPAPGQVFSLAREEVLPDMYEDMAMYTHLWPRYEHPRLLRSEGEASPSPSPRVYHLILTYDMYAGVEGGNVEQPWRRYTVYDFAYGWTLTTRTSVESNKERETRWWLMEEALRRRDWCDIFEDLAVACDLTFKTRTSLVKVTEDAAVQQPPQRLYFYERVHDYPNASLDPTIDWPWGFWSTDPDDGCDIRKFDYSHLSRDPESQEPASHSIAFLGVSDDRYFTWVQLLGPWMFKMEVQVEVTYYSLTKDECLMLREMHACADERGGTESRFQEIVDADSVMDELSESDSGDDDVSMIDAWFDSMSVGDELEDTDAYGPPEEATPRTKRANTSLDTNTSPAKRPKIDVGLGLAAADVDILGGIRSRAQV